MPRTTTTAVPAAPDAAASPGAPADHDRTAEEAPPTTGPVRHGWVLAAVCAACLAPLLAAAIGLAAKGWVPIGEFAQAELRVRDFWAHPPTLGAVGRLRTATDVSSHPGPAAWWAMYPVYGAFGRTAVALSTAVAAAAGAWLVATLALAWRRGGDALAVMAGLGALVLMVALGPTTFLEPWNPWFAVMPFMCMVLATWLVVDGRPWALVLATAAGSYCVQAHFGYAPLVGALGLAAVVGLWWTGPQAGRSWRSLAAPVGASVAVGLVMWALPVWQQLTGDPGNLTVTLQAYREEAGREVALGLGGAIRLVGSYLNVRAPALVLQDLRPAERSPDAGTLVMVLAWALAGVVAWRRRAEVPFGSALRLLVVTAVGALAAVFAASRVVGEVFGYLVLWLGVLAIVVAVATVWTAWLVLAAPGGPLAPRARRWAAIGAAGLLTATAGFTTVSFADPPVPSAQLSGVADELVGPVAAALDPDGAYLVRWDDPVAFGGLGTALLSELERRGIRTGVDERLRVEMRPDRVLAEGDSDGALWVVSGAAIEQWRRVPGVQELAYADPRSPEERTRYRELRAGILAELERLDAGDLAVTLDRNHWVVRSDPRIDARLRDRIDELTDLGLPTAVFLAPPELAQPSPGEGSTGGLPG